jgi:Swiss Army Knife protein, DSP-PTPase phosphatase domain
MSIYWISRCIAQGGRPPQPAADYPWLRAQGITHVLDLSGDPAPRLEGTESPHILREAVEDFTLIPEEKIRRCLDHMHAVLREPDTKLYIHCGAGHGRSPTILWLYLSACGMEPQAAERLIRSKNRKAKPGGDALVDETHLPFGQRYGREHFLPLQRPEIIEPVP